MNKKYDIITSRIMKRRILQFLILFAMLVGIPLACAWLGGYDNILRDVANIAPQCGEWPNQPERLWNCRRPFAWWAFFLVAAIGCGMVAPFVWRGARRLRSKVEVEQRSSTSFPLWGWAGLAVMTAGWIAAWNRFPALACVQWYTYIPLWFGLIVVVNAFIYKRMGRSPLSHETGRFIRIALLSSVFWWFFEFLNRFVWNWFYVGIDGITPAEYIFFATISFATVLPGVMSVAELLGTFRFFSGGTFSDMFRVNLRSLWTKLLLAAVTLFGLTGIVFIPEFAYPFLWVSPLCGFVLVKLLYGEQCALDDITRGDWNRIVRYALAALICGLIWEMWNIHSLAKWIYAVPYVHRFQYFEMPLLGLFGYIPFGVECLMIVGNRK